MSWATHDKPQASFQRRGEHSCPSSLWCAPAVRGHRRSCTEGPGDEGGSTRPCLQSRWLSRTGPRGPHSSRSQASTPAHGVQDRSFLGFVFLNARGHAVLPMAEWRWNILNCYCRGAEIRALLHFGTLVSNICAAHNVQHILLCFYLFMKTNMGIL